MPVLEDLNTTWTEKEQAEDAFTARATLENASMVLNEAHIKIQAIVDSGNFNTVPTDLKVALNQWWTIFKTARASILANADIMDVYNWRP